MKEEIIKTLKTLKRKDERGNNNKGRVFTKVEDKRGDRSSTK